MWSSEENKLAFVTVAICNALILHLINAELRNTTLQGMSKLISYSVVLSYATQIH